jgi:hypothetical protein
MKIQKFNIDEIRKIIKKENLEVIESLINDEKILNFRLRENTIKEDENK